MHAVILQAEDAENLRHMLGCHPRYPKDWGYRNYFYVADCDISSMMRLKAVGLVVCQMRDGQSVFFATEVGCIFAGISKDKIKQMKKEGNLPKYEGDGK